MIATISTEKFISPEVPNDYKRIIPISEYKPRQPFETLEQVQACISKFFGNNVPDDLEILILDGAWSTQTDPRVPKGTSFVYYTQVAGKYVKLVVLDHHIEFPLDEKAPPVILNHSTTR